MFLGMQDFDFWSNRIKFYPVYPNFTQIGLNLAQICLKKFAIDATASPVFTPLIWAHDMLAKMAANAVP